MNQKEYEEPKIDVRLFSEDCLLQCMADTPVISGPKVEADDPIPGA